MIADADLPMLAAQWLVDGYDSPSLRELAGLTRTEATQAHHMMSAVLAELGHPLVPVDVPWDELPWRGYWTDIWWFVDQIDRTYSPYAAAQRVLDVLGDVPELWEPVTAGAFRNSSRRGRSTRENVTVWPMRSEITCGRSRRKTCRR
ncbi:hypothetical protein [Actinopolymorpha pittospori]